MDCSGDTRLTRRSFLQIAGGTGLAALGGPAALGLAASKSVQFAVIMDQTGSGAVYGISVLHGMRIAATEINLRGGVGGHALQLNVSDGRSDPTRIATLVRIAARHTPTVALLGPTLSSEAVAVDPIAQAARLPVLAVSNTVPGLTAIGDYIFRLPLGDDQIIPVVMGTTRKRLHYRRVALLYDNVNTATAGAAKIFKVEVARMGLSLVASATFPSGSTQFYRSLAAIAATKPDAIPVSALAQDAVLILKQRVPAGITAATPIIGANGLNTPAIIRGAGLEADGVIVGTIFNPAGTWAWNRHFRAVFAHRYRQAPDAFAAQGYDGIYAVATALRGANSTSNRTVLRAALAKLKDVPSVLAASGHFSFNPGRQADLTPTVQIVRQGRFVPFP